LLSTAESLAMTDEAQAAVWGSGDFWQDA
jgi:hypothetical protein